MLSIRCVKLRVTVYTRKTMHKHIRKRAANIMIVLGVALSLAGLTVGVSALSGQYLNKKTTQNAKACTKDGKNLIVHIKNNSVSEPQITAHRCDVLTIENLDDMDRLIAFGQHDRHISYDGISTQALKKDESFTIQLDVSGTYRFHDHYHDEVQGEFLVTR